MRHFRNAALTLMLALTFLAVAPNAQASDEAESSLWDSVVEFVVGLFDDEQTGDDPSTEAGPIHDPAG